MTDEEDGTGESDGVLASEAADFGDEAGKDEGTDARVATSASPFDGLTLELALAMLGPGGEGSASEPNEAGEDGDESAAVAAARWRALTNALRTAAALSGERDSADGCVTMARIDGSTVRRISV